MLTALSAAARVHAHQSVNLESLSEGWARDGKSITPISYEQLEERLRSLDYALDTAAKTCPLAKNRREERSGTPMKMRREDGVAMSSYRGWKMLNIWRAVSAEYGHLFDGIFRKMRFKPLWQFIHVIQNTGFFQCPVQFAFAGDRICQSEVL